MVLMASLLLRISLTDEYLIFLKRSMRPWLVASGIVLAVLGVVRFVAAARTPTPEAPAPEEHDDNDHEHSHDHGSQLAWLLILPFVVVFAAAPQPLGAFAASRQPARTPPPPSVGIGMDYPPLHAAGPDGVHELLLIDFVARAIYDDRAQMKGEPVRLVGFVAPDPNGGPHGFLLTRFALSCCAADGRPIQVAIRRVPHDVPPPDTWVVVEGTWLPDPSGHEPRTPALAAKSLRIVPKPAAPYES
jgi:uncharacterized repeat protein (TIGR03943 family)